MSLPAEVLVDVKPTNTAGKTITKHVTCLRRYTGAGKGEQKGALAEEDDDADDLAEELGAPERGVEREIELSVPIQHHQSTEASEMRDIP